MLSKIWWVEILILIHFWNIFNFILFYYRYVRYPNQINIYYLVSGMSGQGTYDNRGYFDSNTREGGLYGTTQPSSYQPASSNVYT
jgi:hypothetical protein